MAPLLLQLESHCSAPCEGLAVAPLFAATSESLCIKWTGQLHHYAQPIGLTLGVFPALGELLAFFFGIASALFDIRDCILIFILPIRQVCCFLTQTKFRFSLFLFSLHGSERLLFLSLCLFSRGLFGFSCQLFPGATYFFVPHVASFRSSHLRA